MNICELMHLNQFNAQIIKLKNYHSEIICIKNNQCWALDNENNENEFEIVKWLRQKLSFKNMY